MSGILLVRPKVDVITEDIALAGLQMGELLLKRIKGEPVSALQIAGAPGNTIAQQVQIDERGTGMRRPPTEIQFPIASPASLLVGPGGLVCMGSPDPRPFLGRPRTLRNRLRAEPPAAHIETTR